MTTQSLEEIVSSLDKETLIKLLCQQAYLDTHLKAMLVAKYGTQTPAATKDEYKTLIREILQSGMDRHGFIDYRNVGEVMRGVDDLVSQAKSLEEKHEIHRALPIAQAAIEELVPALQYADDDGDIGGTISEAFELLEAIATQLKTENREEFFQYCLKESRSKAYEGWDYHWQFLEIAGLVANTPEKQQKLFELLDTFAEKGKRSFTRNHEQLRAAKIKLSVLEWHRNKKAIEPFLQEHLEIDGIRMIAINKRLKERKFDEVRKLCEDGIRIAQAHKDSGIVGQYQKILLKIEGK